MPVRKAAGYGVRIAGNVTASMKAEGFLVSASTKANCIAIATGKKSADQLVKARLAALTETVK